MKKFRLTVLNLFAIVVLLVFQNCPGSDPDTPKDVTTNILTSKTWVYSSVNTPDNSASIGTDWMSFTVSFTTTSMITSGHYLGAEAVWPSGTYTVSEDGKSITRQDGVVMTLNPIAENNFTTRFTVPAGTNIGGRITALDGEYTFNMK